MLRVLRKSAAARAAKRPAVASARAVNAALRRVNALGHAAQHYIEWGLPPLPEWYDHYLDANWAWPRRGGSLFLERGIFGSLAVLPGATVLELCCGDGFNARHFYAPRAEAVTAVDFDPGAIAFARRRNAHPAVRYLVGDIRTSMPSGTFTNVMLDAAIEHFTEDEIRILLAGIGDRLGETGVLSGYTVVELAKGRKHLVHHEREFADKADLMQFLAGHFRHACVFETVHPNRTNLYFYGAQRLEHLPFAQENPAFLWHGAGPPRHLGAPRDQ